MKLVKYTFLCAAIGLLFSCSDDDISIKNDMLKRSTGPAIAGYPIDFAYAAGTTNGRLSKVEAQASIAGASGTGFELYSYYTNHTNVTVDGVSYQAGSDVPLRSVKESTTNGVISTAVMQDKIDETYVNPAVPVGTSEVDLIAATLRYAWVVPEEAKGKTVTFTFSAESTTGESVSYKTQSYEVSKMDMKRLIGMKTGEVCYFSIEDMKAYSRQEVESGNLSAKIDFIYLYQSQMNGMAYGHSFISPTTDAAYVAISGLIPSGWTKNKTVMEARGDNTRDAQLKGATPNVYIDDIDFETLDLSNAVDYVLGLGTDRGAFMETADGKYRAYIYVNSINDGEAATTVSIKRYPLK